MKITSKILIAFYFCMSANCVFGKLYGANDRSGPITSPEVKFGYHGPVKLGPFSIDNQIGGIGFAKLLTSAAPRGMYVCYYDEAANIYLVVERGADDHSLVRGVTISQINVCPRREISHAIGLSAWVTGEGIRLGSSVKDVVAKYGSPSQIDDLRTDPKFTFSPYDLKQGASYLSRDGRVLSYLPKLGEPDTSHAFFGIHNGVVVWMTLSDNE
jgi:hypothetical protein